MKIHRFLSLMPAFVLALALISALTPTASAAEIPMDWPAPVGTGVTLTASGLYDISSAPNGIDLVAITANGIALTGTHNDLCVRIYDGITLTLKDAYITK